MKKEYEIGAFMTDEIKKDINELTEEEMELYKELRRILKKREEKRQYTKEEKREALKRIKGCFAGITTEDYEKKKMEAIIK